MSNKNNFIKETILQKIATQQYLPGQMIDTEATLSAQLQVSRMTLRKALEELINDGTLYREKNRGVFVSGKPKYHEFRCGSSFTQEVLHRGMTPSTQSSSLKVIKADEILANKLQIKPNDSVWEVTRVRCADNIPVFFATEYYPQALCPELNLQIINSSIYDYLKTQGIEYAFLDQKLEAALADEHIGQALNIPLDHPLIKMSLITYMNNGIPFNCGTTYCRTDKFTLAQSIFNHPN